MCVFSFVPFLYIPFCFSPPVPHRSLPSRNWEKLMGKARYCGEVELGEAMWAFTTGLDHFRPAMFSWSCFVGLCNLIISLPDSFLCGSAVLGLHPFLPANPGKVLLSFFILFSHLVFLPFSFHLREKKKKKKRFSKSKVWKMVLWGFLLNIS